MKENSTEEQSSVKDRLKRFIEHLGISQSEFEKRTGLSNGYVNNIRKSIKAEKFDENIAPVFPDLNKFWLLHAEGEMLTPAESQKIETQLMPKDGIKNPVPYFNVDFAGGWNSEEIFSTSRPDFYISNPEFDRCEFACNLVGHSISRRIPNRSIIGLKQVDDWQTYFPTNELYGIVMKNDLRTVKIVKRSKNKNFLLLVPDPLPEYNQTQYEPEEVPIEFVERFYQIVAWAQFERLAQ